MTQPEHEKAILAAHARYSLALSALDEHNQRTTKLADELLAAEGELRALARRTPK
jgi:hypothetical protein